MEFKKTSSLINFLDKKVEALPESKRSFAIEAGFKECSVLRKLLRTRKAKFETLQAFFDALGYDLKFKLEKKKPK